MISPNTIDKAKKGKLNEQESESAVNGITEHEANVRFVQGVLADASTSAAGQVRRKIEAAGMYAGLAVTHGVETTERFASAVPFQGIIDTVVNWTTPRNPAGACSFIRSQMTAINQNTLDVLEVTANGLRNATRHGTGAASPENLTAVEL